MSKLKMLKLPKKPKRSASVSVLENYLKKVDEVKRENARRTALNKKRDALAARVAGIGKSSAYSAPVKRRKKTTATKKRKTTSKKRRR